MEESGISRRVIDSPNLRITLKQLAKLSITLIDVLDDELYGLLEKPMRRGTFKLASMSAIAGDTITESLQLHAEFMNLLENTWYHDVSVRDECVSYRLVQREGATLHHRIALEYIYSTLYRSLCWMANQRLQLRRVDLSVESPKFPERYRYMFYDAPLRFAQKQSGLIFTKTALDTANIRDKNALKAFLKQMPLTLLTQTVHNEDLNTQVRAYLERSLLRSSRLPSIEEAASKLGLHTQTFRRRLKHEQTSFSRIKSETRRDLALGFLLEGRINVAEMSERLDFSEPSAFIRAFKQWTGVTPTDYRANVTP